MLVKGILFDIGYISEICLEHNMKDDEISSFIRYLEDHESTIISTMIECYQDEIAKNRIHKKYFGDIK